MKDIEVLGPTFSGLQFGGTQGVSNVSIDGVTIRDSGAASIRVNSESRGSAQLDRVVVSGTRGLQNDAPNAFNLQKGAGNSGW